MVRRINVIGIRCTKCDRHGRLKLSTLIERYGADFAAPDLRTTLNAGCEHADAMVNQPCILYFFNRSRGDCLQAEADNACRPYTPPSWQEQGHLNLFDFD